MYQDKFCRALSMIQSGQHFPRNGLTDQTRDDIAYDFDIHPGWPEFMPTIDQRAHRDQA